MLAMPGLCLAFVLWAVASRRMAGGLQRATLVAAIVLPCAGWTLIRTGGFTGSFDNDLAWRWTATPEQRLLAQGDEFRDAAPGKPVGPRPARRQLLPAHRDARHRRRSAESSPDATRAALPRAGRACDAALDWPGFRGRDRDGIVRGVRINTDWSASPPMELWRRPIGPGWSSFAVHGDLLYTQEQRGDDEIVAAYRVSTGAPVWKHRDAARFWESNGGAGPARTPTFQQRPRVRVRRNRHPERARRRQRPRHLVAQRRRRQRYESAGLGLLILAAPRRRPRHRRRGRQARRLRSRRPARRAGSGPTAARATARRILSTIHGVPQILLLDADAARPASRRPTARGSGNDA